MPENSKEFSKYIVPVLAVVVLAMAFVIGVLWQRINSVKKGSVAGVAEEGNSPTANNPNNRPAANVPEVSSEDHIRGSLDAEVFLVEYSDYYCPYCSTFHSTAKQALSEYGDKIAWVYRHFPLDELHPNARPLAEISECITELGGNDAFWAFSDAVYETKPQDPDAAITLAVSQGINESTLKSCYNDGKYKNLVEEQFQGGISAGVTGTPGNFVINKERKTTSLPGAVPFSNLKSAIDQSLQ